MLDLIRLYIKAGDGGDGKVSFLRNRYVLKGGPDGGDGGDGGHVILIADKELNTLQHLSGIKALIAYNGEIGGKSGKTGNKGQNIVIRVPLGTVVWLYDENKTSEVKRQAFGLGPKILVESEPNERYELEKETHAPPVRIKDEINKNQRPDFNNFLHHKIEMAEGEYAVKPKDKLLKIAQLDRVGMKIFLAYGGKGGRGNRTFKSSILTTPLIAEYGAFGEQKIVFLELRLLANVGLVGCPNVGKSTLLARVTKAKPRIANYPFTTLKPNLGVMTLSDERSLILADIPGLIAGASLGKGLGYNFLRHIHNCAEIVYVLALTETDLLTEKSNNAKIAGKLFKQYLQLFQEIQDYNLLLTQKNTLIIINKCDLYGNKLKQEIESIFKENNLKVIFISAYTGEGIELMKEKIWQKFNE